MTHRATIILLAAATFLGGCAAVRDLDKPVGQQGFNDPLGASYRQQLQAQKFDPIPAGSDPVTGMDGKLSQRAIQAYQQPTPEDKGPTFNEVMRFLMQDKQ
ncbi:hypothetical protein [Desulfovibrio psychrotolerans]|uniref:Lipoprotein n=1 Tax=Desulfovibrio psychrotolerans TaxID=415242 RepID=A0A7J0BV04_9BACT|nr:hypothetical protein [Desulfovibrio psychrotolerans]GFM37001.1 hypothetical protein DSM19430T_16850 [Desulfovibrio psychrotolerans]